MRSDSHQTPRSATPLDQTVAALAAGGISSRALVTGSFEAIDRCADQAIFTRLYRKEAIGQADAIDLRRAAGEQLGPLAGLPVSVKDLFDIAGDVTMAGSPLLAKNAPAVADAAVIARLRQAGAVVVGKTNMSELAYSGLGLNSLYGNPLNALDASRVPGGSSSGSAVAVARGQCVVSIGSDTGGSIRIPAAFNGLVGLKPTRSRIAREGTVALSHSQDTVGTIGRSVADCALFDAVMAGEAPIPPERRELAGVRIAMPQRHFTEDLAPAVARAFEAVLDRLSRAGAQIVDIPFSEFARVQDVMALGGLVGPEAYAGFSPLLATATPADPHVLRQIMRFSDHPAHKYRAALEARTLAQNAYATMMESFDCFACPTVAILPPHLSQLVDEETTDRINRTVLRNTSPFNILDVPAISVPCHALGAPQVGLMLAGKAREDRALIEIAVAVETLV